MTAPPLAARPDPDLGGLARWREDLVDEHDLADELDVHPAAEVAMAAELVDDAGPGRVPRPCSDPYTPTPDGSAS